MNTAARALAQNTLSKDRLTSLISSPGGVAVVFLFFLVLVSSFSVVYTKNLKRQLTSELAGQQHIQDNLSIEWGQLLLEQGALATQARIEKFAEKRLNLLVPNSEDIVIVKID